MNLVICEICYLYYKQTFSQQKSSKIIVNLLSGILNLNRFGLS